MSLLQEIKTLQEISNDQNVTIAKAYFRNKDKVKRGDKIIDLQTSKAVFSYDAETDGYVEYAYPEGEDVPVGVVVARIFTKPDDIQSDPKIPGIGAAKDKAAASASFSGAALKLIEKEGIDKAVFAGKSFVTLEDVQAALGQTQSPDHTFKNISKAKKIEIEALSDVQSSHLGCMVSIFVNTQNTLAFAQKHVEVLKTSLLPFIIYETARLLNTYPEFNAFYNDGRVAFYKTVNIGVAIDLEQGLKVVKLTDMDKKDIKSVEKAIIEAADKYLDNKLALNDITGMTFTITDLSAQGISFFVPLINTKQSAILGISAIDEKLQRCVLSLTFDHRITEGKRAGEFLFELKERLESYHAPVEAVHACARCFMTLMEIKSYNGIGLFKVMDCDGQEKFLCESCIAGW